MSPRCISSIGLGTSVTASAPLRSAAKVPASGRGRTLSLSIALCNDWARLPVEFHGGGAECVPRSAISVGIALGSARASLRRSRPRNRAALGHRSPTAVNRFEPRAATSWSTTAVRRRRPRRCSRLERAVSAAAKSSFACAKHLCGGRSKIALSDATVFVPFQRAQIIVSACCTGVALSTRARLTSRSPRRRQTAAAADSDTPAPSRCRRFPRSVVLTRASVTTASLPGWNVSVAFSVLSEAVLLVRDHITTLRDIAALRSLCVCFPRQDLALLRLFHVWPRYRGQRLLVG